MSVDWNCSKLKSCLFQQSSAWWASARLRYMRRWFDSANICSGANSFWYVTGNPVFRTMPKICWVYLFMMILEIGFLRMLLYRWCCTFGRMAQNWLFQVCFFNLSMICVYSCVSVKSRVGTSTYSSNDTNLVPHCKLKADPRFRVAEASNPIFDSGRLPTWYTK